MNNLRSGVASIAIILAAYTTLFLAAKSPARYRYAVSQTEAVRVCDESLVAKINSPDISRDKKHYYILQLANSKPSEQAIRTLVEQIESTEPYPSDPTVIIGIGRSPDATLPTPAQRVLQRWGRRVVPLLVAEYVAFFEVSEVANWPHRKGFVKVNLTTWEPLQHQEPLTRLLRIVEVLSFDYDIASYAISYTRRLAPEYPIGSRQRRACDDLIDEINSREAAWRRAGALDSTSP